MTAVLDLNARDIIEHLIIANIDVIGHANVNRSVFDLTENIIFDKSVMTELGKNAVEACIDDPVVPNREVISRLAHDGIALVLGNFEPLDTEAISRVQNSVIQHFFAIEVRPLAVFDHPNQERYPGQKIAVVLIEGYAYLVPFVENEEEIFLKTIIPSRKATRQYLGEAHD